jgi:flagellar M-ring protein FliF
MAFPDFFKKGLTDFKGLTPLQQIAYVMVMVGVISGLAVTVFYSTRPDYQMLFSNLSADDAGKIVAYLKDNKIPYKLEAGGTSVLVPSKDVYETRMGLATDGMPLGGAEGWELFDGKSMGMTDFEQKVNYQRALQGELARTIQQVDKVEKARVHIVVPEQALFAEETKEATASVIVKLRGRGELEKDEVQGIVHLVSSAVEGMKPSGVTVMNSLGQILTRTSGEEGDGALSASLLEYKRQVESAKEKQIVALLGKTIGAGKIVASVSADVDFTQVRKHEEKFDPDGQVVRSEQNTDESETGSETNASGAPGTAGNVPDQPAETASTQNSNSARKKGGTINYEISKVTSEVVTPAGDVKRLSIAVLLDGKYEPVPGEKGAGGRPKTKYVPWEKKEMAQFEELVKKAVGFDETRGDQIEVANVSFQGQEEWADLEGPRDNRETIFTAVKYGLALLGAVAFFFLVLRPLIRWLTTEEEPISDEVIAKLLPGRVADIEERLLEGGSESRPNDEMQIEEMRKQLHDRRRAAVENARRDRKAITMMVRKWLKEDDAAKSAQGGA